MTKPLPLDFSDLEPWTFWVLEREVERHAQRLASSMDELRAFCDALTPRMEALIQHLSGFPWGTALDEANMNLYHLGLGYMEAIIPIDLGWNHPQAEDSYPVDRLVLAHR